MMGAAPASAQIRGDATLGGSRPSQVVSVGARALIQGGVSQGSNLFHSFLEFNVNEGQQVYFANPDGIVNILSRVTGGNRSEILGTLGVEGEANLFLLNPNGILFGPNARLDVQGAFSASTANQIDFEDGVFFSATQPQLSLLTVSAPVGLQYGAPGNLTSSDRQVNLIGRQVNIIDPSRLATSIPGQGEITLVETALEQFSGEADLAIAATQHITLQNLVDKTLDLQPGSGEVYITADADGDGVGAFTMTDSADTIRTFGRDIAIAAARLDLGNINTALTPNQDAGQALGSARSVVQASGPALTTLSGQLSTATDVDLYEIYISGTEPFSASTVVSPETGQAANPPNTQLFLFDATGRGLYANDNGPDCNCRQSTLLPESPLPAGRYYLGVASYATSPTSAAGAIFPNGFDTLTFNTLATATGPGRSAPLNDWVSQPGIEVGDYDITLTGVSGVAGQVTEGPLADSGDITLTTTRGSLRSGQLTTAATRTGGNVALSAQGGGLEITGTINTLGGQGNGGQVLLQATDDIRFWPGASVLTRGQIAGELSIQGAGDIVVQGGLLSQQSTINQPNHGERGGGFEVQGQSLLLQDGAQLVSETLGTAPLKDSRVEVQDEVILSGLGSVNLFSPFGLLATQVGSDATGEGGALILDVGTLRVTDAAVVATRSFGRGNAGDLTIRGDEVVVSGAVAIDEALAFEAGESIFESELSTEAERAEDELLFQGGIQDTTPFLLSEANAGDLRIEVGRLRVENGGEVSAGTHSLGDGGNFTIVADEVIVTGQTLGESSELGTETVPEFLGARPPEGNAGNLVIETNRLSVTNGGQIEATTLALGGNAGRIAIAAREVEVAGGFVYDGEVKTSSISSEVLNAEEEGLQGDTTRAFGGRGGTLEITAETVRVWDGGRISASTAGNGAAGDVTIVAPDIELSGAFTPTVDLASLTPLTGDSIPSGVFAASEVVGQNAGNLQIRADNLLRLNNRATLAASTQGAQGNITLTGGTVLMTHGSQITTNAQGSSTGGNITLDLDLLVAAPLLGNNDITANAEAGSGGQIRINSRSPILGFQVGEGDPFRAAKLTPAETPTNDITAFSQFNPAIDTGTVTVEPPELDPTAGILELPTLVDPSDRIATGCAAAGGNRFAVTGQGGLPADPRRGLRGLALARDFRLYPENRLAAEPETPSDTRDDLESGSSLPTEDLSEYPIIEAQAMVTAADGTPMLIATATDRYSPTHVPSTCQPS
ncbi:MAG: filamentous hemagglutinin N-terminal domain-containing protein [Cyanobacteria bacterium J06635_1]